MQNVVPIHSVTGGKNEYLGSIGSKCPFDRNRMVSYLDQKRSQTINHQPRCKPDCFGLRCRCTKTYLVDIPVNSLVCRNCYTHFIRFMGREKVDRRAEKNGASQPLLKSSKIEQGAESAKQQQAFSVPHFLQSFSNFDFFQKPWFL